MSERMREGDFFVGWVKFLTLHLRHTQIPFADPQTKAQGPCEEIYNTSRRLNIQYKPTNIPATSGCIWKFSVKSESDAHTAEHSTSHQSHP